MKDLISVINESAAANIVLNVLSNASYDVSSINMNVYGSKAERLKDNKALEQSVINTLSELLPDYNVMSCKEWCDNVGLNYSPKIDLYYGDIIITSLNNIPMFNIDLKVGTGKNLGTPDALSLANFGNTTVKEAGKFVYLCINKDNKRKPVVVDVNKLRQFYIKGKGASFIASKDRTRKLNDTIFDNVAIKSQKSFDADVDVNTLYEEDFVPTGTIEQFAL